LLLVRSPDDGSIVGYAVTDYLLQRLARQRRSEPLPALAWQALTDWAGNDQNTLLRLADNAVRLAQNQNAEPLYRHAANAGNKFAASRLADLLAWRSDVTELRMLADAGFEYAVGRLVQLLAKQNNVGELRARADRGDGYAADRLFHLLAEQGRIEEVRAFLRTRADAGDDLAAARLFGLLVKQSDDEELRARANDGDKYAALWLMVDGHTDVLGALTAAFDNRPAVGLHDLVVDPAPLDQIEAQEHEGTRDAHDGAPAACEEEGDEPSREQ
jgi:hypothetical protein